MVNQEYHKGSFCVYTSVFCQEGYCSECEVYRKRSAAVSSIDRNDGVKSQKRRQTVLVH
jgi:hypothetical protein